MGLNPGRLDQRVRIERPQRVRNEFGEPAIASWELVSEEWAQVLLPRARGQAQESALAARAVNERTCQFLLRWPLDLRGEDRIVWENEAYGVEGIVFDRRAGEALVTATFRSGTDGR